MSNSVPLDDICRAFDILIDQLRLNNIDKITFRNESYWYVGGEDGQDVYKEAKLSLGDYEEDISHIRGAQAIGRGIPYNLAQSLSSTLHYISILSPESTPLD